MKDFDYTVETGKTFEDAVRAVEEASVAQGFRVLHTHDIANTLTEKGFPREPLKIVEICNAKHASEVLQLDPKLALMLPCPISVYTHEGKTLISALRPNSMVEFYPEAGIEAIAAAVEESVVAIVNEARG
jgi:uncharacterized protein (DUF302 family)